MKNQPWRLMGLCLLLLSFTGLLTAQSTLIYDPDAYVESFVGSGFRGYLDGSGMFTLFNSPGALSMDSTHWPSDRMPDCGTITPFTTVSVGIIRSC